MPGWLILNPEFPSVINHPWSGKCLAELSAEHKPYSLTFEGYTRCSVGVCAWGGSENGRDGKWLGEISFSEGWGAGEVPGEGKKRKSHQGNNIQSKYCCLKTKETSLSWDMLWDWK